MSKSTHTIEKLEYKAVMQSEILDIHRKINELIEAHEALREHIVYTEKIEEQNRIVDEAIKDQGEDECAWCGGGAEHYPDCRMNKPDPIAHPEDFMVYACKTYGGDHNGDPCPIARIVERLEEEIKFHSNYEGHSMFSSGKVDGLEQALAIVKEEGGRHE